MLTEGLEGVEDTSIAMYENVKAFGFNSCLDKKEGCLNFWQPDEDFKILHVRQSVFCRCRVNTDRKNRITFSTLCYVLLDHYSVAKYSVKFCNRSAVSGHDFQNTPCPAVQYF